MEDKEQIKILKDRIANLEKSLEEYRQAFQFAPVAMAMNSLDGRFVEVNKKALRMFGLSRDEVIGHTSVELGLNHSENHEHQTLPHLVEDQGAKNLIKTIWTKSGKACEVQLLIDLVKEQGEPRFVSAFLDITEMQDAQLALIHSSKFVALGKIVASIAHQINTPLAIISVSTTEVQEHLSQTEVMNPRVRDAIDVISETIPRIARIIESLRKFAKDGESDRTRFYPVKDLIEATVAICGERFKHHGVSLSVSNIDSKLLLDCRPNELTQVLINLLDNAFEAVTGLSEKWVVIDISEKAHTIEISVTDSGNGIAPEIRQKIMKPFFTTKPVGQGTGLGLAVSKGIVESHKGSISLDAQSDRTRFLISIPKQQVS